MIKKYPLLLVFLLLAFFIYSNEPLTSFFEMNPIFIGDFPYPSISLDLLKNRVFQQTYETYDYDSAGRRTYGDTYEPTIYRYCYYFDSAGKITRWLEQTLQKNRVVSYIDCSYTYNRDSIYIKIIKKMFAYSPTITEYQITCVHESDAILFTKEHVSGLTLNVPGLRFTTRKITSNTAVSEISDSWNPEREEDVWSAIEDFWVSTTYQENEIKSWTKRTYSGVILEILYWVGIIDRFSVQNGLGIVQSYRNGELLSEDILERRLNPAGFLEFEQITKKDGGVSTYRAEIIDEKE